MAKKKKGFGKITLAILGFVLGLVGGFYGLSYLTAPKTEDVVVTEEIFYSKGESKFDDAIDIANSDISIHFLELGNKYTGDCTYIKAGDNDILIDCGSKSNSIPTISAYLNNYVTDGVLEYVIVTHAHQDHYAGFATSSKMDGIFDLFKCETIIDFAGTAKGKTDTALYKNYESKLQKAIDGGASHYTALDCIEERNGATREYALGSNITLNILDSYYYKNPDKANENNNSVCCMFTQQIADGESKNFLFTGDLEAEGEEALCNLNSLPQVDLYKAGHHGSRTSSSKEFIDTIKPKTVCVCCCAGSSEYTTTAENQFPTQEFITNVGAWTDEIYVTTLCLDYKNNEFTSFNGNIVYMSTENGYNVKCSNNNCYLKDSDWFKESGRVWPSETKNAAVKKLSQLNNIKFVDKSCARVIY